MSRPNPAYELTEDADDDLLAIARYTIKNWGVEQTRRYEAALENRFAAIGLGTIQGRIFLKKRPEIRVTHCEHHYIFYLHRNGRCPLIIAVLHESMDLVVRLRKRLKA
jgi:toxin ParE1/3/4